MMRGLLAFALLTMIFVGLLSGTTAAGEEDRFRNVLRRTDGTVGVAGVKLGRQLQPIGLVTSWPIGSKDGTGERVGTGFLISPCLVLTNLHVAFALTEPRSFSIPLAVGRRHKVRVTFSGFQPKAATPVAWGDYDEWGDNDWAILKLEECVGGQIGWLELSRLSLAEIERLPMKLMMAGFPGGPQLEPIIPLSYHCSITERIYGRSAAKSTCASAPGGSGSAVFAPGPPGSGMQVVAIYTGFSGEEVAPMYPSVYSVVVLTSDVFRHETARNLLRDDLISAGPNPLPLISEISTIPQSADRLYSPKEIRMMFGGVSPHPDICTSDDGEMVSRISDPDGATRVVISNRNGVRVEERGRIVYQNPSVFIGTRIEIIQNWSKTGSRMQQRCKVLRRNADGSWIETKEKPTKPW